MKLIMENWKRYLSEASTDWKSLDPKNPKHYQAIFNLKADPMSPDFAKVKKLKDIAMRAHVLRSKEAKKEPQISTSTGRARKALYQPQRGKIEQDLHDIGKERSIGSHAFRNAVNSIVNFGLMFADPTGQFGGFEDSEEGGKKAVSSIELFNRSREDYKKDPSLFNGAMIALSGLAFIPLLGGGAKAVRAATKGMKPATAKELAAVAQLSIRNAKKVRDELYNLPAGQQTTQIKKVADDLDAGIKAALPVKKLVYDELGVFTKHIKDNIPIPKNIALDIIKKTPSAAVKGKPVYRGMTVSKEYILKKYGQEILSKGPGVHVIDVKKSFTPRKGTGTSSWSLDPNESTLWSGAALNKKPFNPETDVRLLIVGGGPNDVGLNITKRADEIGSKYTHFDQAEVSMIGNVEIQRVVITVGTSPKGKGFLSDSLAANKKMKSGFYPAADRPEMMNLLKSSGVL